MKRRVRETSGRYSVNGETPQAIEIDLESFAPPEALRLAKRQGQRAIPAIAKDQLLSGRIEHITQTIPTAHQLVLGDARNLSEVPDNSVHLALTSPPYWTLKTYPRRNGQLGGIRDYEEFLLQLDSVWKHVLRILVPGGRLVIVVGDVCLPRRAFGRHVVFPLHASIQEHCRRIGFDNLAPIVWHKIANAKFEVSKNGSSFLGKPYEPNAIVKNDIEYILFQRKSGGYRQPSIPARILSTIPEESHRQWFQQIWNITGAPRKEHPAPFPLKLAERLIRMFSFVGDTVLDPFMGTGTTNAAACRWGRNSIGVEIDPSYFDTAVRRLRAYRPYRLLVEAQR